MRLNVGMKWVKRVCICIALVLLIYWLAIIIATELMRHHEQTLDFLGGVDSIKHWFILMRIAIYAGCYFLCGWLMRLIQPKATPDSIKTARAVLIRLFIVYELFFGINIIAFLSH